MGSQKWKIIGVLKLDVVAASIKEPARTERRDRKDTGICGRLLLESIVIINIVLSSLNQKSRPSSSSPT